MLANIKCKYLLEIIFNNLRKRLKLKIVKYNKRFLEKLDLDIKEFQKYKLLKEINEKLNLNIKDIDINDLDLTDKKLNDDALKYLDKIEFENLRVLNLSKNKIIEIKLLLKYNWNKLDLSNNMISDITSFQNYNFEELKELNLSNNKLSEISEFKNLKLKKLKVLNLSSNLF